MKKIVIIGATSAIAESVSRIWAKRGDQIFLVARNSERLNVLSKDLYIRGASYVENYSMDANDVDSHLPMLNKAFKVFGVIDIILIAYGTLLDQKECEQSIDLTIQEIKTNGLSVIALLTHVANFFEKQQTGTIAVITSVAGDRGRQSNYIYGAAKAMVSTFMSGLRQRLHKVGVSVVTIKPGFIDTPMTDKFRKGILWVQPESISKRLVCAIDQSNGEIYVPRFWGLIMGIICSLPEKIFIKIKI